MLLETNCYAKSFSLLDSDYTPPDLQLLKRLQLLIEKDFRENRDVNVYAQKLNCSLRFLNKLTRAYLNKTVYELLQDRIHEEALRLLQYSTLTIKQIAFEKGCCDPPYFCRCFKTRTGESPRNFRRRLGFSLCTEGGK